MSSLAEAPSHRREDSIKIGAGYFIEEGASLNF
jgi:hypothetical protein